MVCRRKKPRAFLSALHKADTDITRRYGGTGLGLAITKQMVELQGGTIALKSDAGSGAEFIFRLPYTKSSEPSSLAINKDFLGQLQFDSIKRILLVEDNLMNRKLATVILEENGFEIEIAENGSKAVEILKERAFDLILMDIQMPVMDGYQATTIIRDELHIPTPILAMTAHALAGEKEKCIQLGMNDYLSKPFTERDLLLKIAQWSLDKEFTPEVEETKGKIIDLSYLIEQTRNKKTFILEMVDIFRKHNPEDIAALETCYFVG